MEARRRAYAVLAELVSRGPTPESRAAATASPLLREALAGYASLDEAAADHQHAFGLCVPPFEGAFLDPEGRAGASAAATLHETYRAIGFGVDPRGDDPEHLATELGALAWLSGREAQASERGDGAAVERARTGATQLLDRHLLRWLPLLSAAVRRLDRPWPTALVEQIEDLVRLHREELGTPVEPGFELPPVPADPLADPRTGLGDVARLLATPALSGVFVSRDDVARIGREVGVPRGFGERAVLLHNLLRGAVHRDALPAVLDALDVLLEGEGATASGPWRERIEHTRRLVARMREAAEALGVAEGADEGADEDDGDGGDRARP